MNNVLYRYAGPVPQLDADQGYVFPHVTACLPPGVLVLKGLAKQSSFEILGIRNAASKRFALTCRPTLPSCVFAPSKWV